MEVKDFKEAGKEIEKIEYDEKEISYRGQLLQDFWTARNARENPHDEFDGMTYTQYCESNRKLANAYIEPKKNKEDTTFVSGTIRQKMVALLSLLNNLNLMPEVRAFDERMVQEVSLGQGLEDIINKTDILDEDEEKQLMRQYTLLEQGNVFIEETWTDKTVLNKDIKKQFDGNNFDTVEWTERLKKVSCGPTRNILMNENVYLGDITIFGVKNQPFIFTTEYLPYDAAKAIYGTWKRWKYVTKDVKYLLQPPAATEYNNNVSLSELQKGHVEIIKAQYKFKNEYAIFINGVLMTPVGLPIPRVWGEEPEYNVEMQTYWVIDAHFAYGRSLPSIMRTKESILNEMLRLAILKTQKSFMPPYGNLTGQILSNKVLMPGKITSGLNPDMLKPVGETSGMTKSELAMIQEIQKSMEEDVPSGGLSAKNPIGVNRMTASQSQAMKHQAEVLTTLTVFAATMLERKAGTMRLYNILENYFEPIAETVAVENGRKYLKKKYRTTSVDKMIEGEGPGQSIVEISSDKTTPVDLIRREERIKRETGKPARINVLNPDVVKNGKRVWYVVVNQKQKKNSDLSKVLFSEMMTTAGEFFPETLNKGYMAERFASVWGEDPTKMFNSGQQIPTEEIPQNGARGSMFPKNMREAGKPVRPNINTLENTQ